MELNDGVLTLKAGSKVYVPNGFEEDGTTPKFDEIILESDTPGYGSGEGWSKLPYIFWYNPAVTDINQSVNHYSGSVAPTETRYMLWYDTTNNLVKYSDDTGATWTSGLSLPICLASNITGSKFDSITRIFNHISFIGKHLFVLPGIKGLIANSRYTNGALKTIPFEINKVLIKENGDAFDAKQWLFYTFDGGLQHVNWYYESDTETPIFKENSNSCFFNPNDNTMYFHRNTTDVYKGICLGTFEIGLDHKYRDIKPRNPFEIIKDEVADFITKKSDSLIPSIVALGKKTSAFDCSDYYLYIHKGCTFYIPDGKYSGGARKWIQYEVPNGLTYKETQSGAACDIFLVWNYTNGIFNTCTRSKSFSGTTTPTWNDASGVDYNYGLYYNTDENKAYYIAPDGNKQCSLPTCILQRNTNGFISLKRLYGFTFIGKTIFALPRTAALLPHELDRNCRAQFVLTVIETPQVLTLVDGSQQKNMYLVMGSNGQLKSSEPFSLYNYQQDNNYGWIDGWYNGVVVGRFNTNDGAVTISGTKTYNIKYEVICGNFITFTPNYYYVKSKIDYNYTEKLTLKNNTDTWFNPTVDGKICAWVANSTQCSIGMQFKKGMDVSTHEIIRSRLFGISNNDSQHWETVWVDVYAGHAYIFDGGYNTSGSDGREVRYYPYVTY